MSNFDIILINICRLIKKILLIDMNIIYHVAKDFGEFAENHGYPYLTSHN